MKAYVCDMCNEILPNSFKIVVMREITTQGFIGRKKKLHLCSECWQRIRDSKKRSETNAEKETV